MKTNTINALIAKEKALLSQEVRSSPAKLKSLLSEAFVEIGTRGNRFTLEEVLQSLPQNAEWRAEISDVECRQLSEEIVQLIYTCKIFRSHRDTGSLSKRSSTWRHEADGWKMVFHQGSNLAPQDI